MSELRTFLRYGQLIVELGERPVVVGRSSSCQVTLDDELASREHCRFELAGGRIVLTDLKSKNGVLVNGAPVRGTQELHHGDTVTVGTQQLVVIRQHREPKMTPASGAPRVASQEAAEQTAQGDFYSIMRGAAAASLASGDLLGAETTSRTYFVALRTLASRGRAAPPGALEGAIELALALADKTGEPRWLEQALDTSVSLRAALATDHARELARIAGRVGVPRRALDDYLAAAKGLGADAASITALRAV